MQTTAVRHMVRPMDIGDISQVMEGEKGVGLAAPQVGVLARVIVWKNPVEADELHTFVNPQITERSEICSTETEGCLSVPGASVEVSRPEEVLVSAQNLGGQALEMRLAGLALAAIPRSQAAQG